MLSWVWLLHISLTLQYLNFVNLSEHGIGLFSDAYVIGKWIYSNNVLLYVALNSEIHTDEF